MGRGAVGVAAAVTAITGAIAGVRGLVSPSREERSAEIQPLRVTTNVTLTARESGSARITIETGSGASTATPAPTFGRLVLGLGLPALLAQDKPSGPDDQPTDVPETTTTVPEHPTTTEDEESEGEETGTVDSGALGTGTGVSPAREQRCGQQATAGAPDGAVTQPAQSPPPEDCPAVITKEERGESSTELVHRRQEIQREAERNFELDRPCERDLTAPECPLTRGLTPTVPGADQADRRGRALRKLALARLAARQLLNTKSARGRDGRREPLGARVDYRVRLCGFDDEPVVFVWSLIYADGARRVPYVWDDRRIAYRLRPRSSACQEVAWQFWAPMPRARGRFTVELTVDGQGETETRRGRPFSS